MSRVMQACTTCKLGDILHTSKVAKLLAAAKPHLVWYCFMQSNEQMQYPQLIQHCFIHKAGLHSPELM